VLLPLGSPLPNDSVAAVRGDSGVLGSLSVPLKWGVVVPPDDYDHWAPKPDPGTDAGDQMPNMPRPAAVADGAWNGWEGETESRFDRPRIAGVIPHSPAAG
jgi:hypothetical protein